jgi:glycosyltransferase involved in cell wall biosynthesis
MVSDFYQPYVGGVEVVVRNLAYALSERGHEVSVATIRAEGLSGYEEDGAIRVHRIRTSTGRVDSLFSQQRPWAPPVPDPDAIIGLRRVIAAEQPQIVHGHDWLARSVLPSRLPAGTGFVVSLHYYTLTCAKKNLLYRGAACTGPALVKCLRCGSAHYGPAKGSLVVTGNFLFAAAERRLVDMYLPVSNSAAIRNGLVGSNAPFEVIPNFLPDTVLGQEEAQELPDQLPDNGFLLYVGDVSKDKGVEVLLDAYRGLGGAAPPLVLIGKLWPGWRPNLPPNAYLFTDWPNAAVRKAQDRCLALVSPSIRPEPFGMVIIETFSARRPVVASKIGGMTDLVDDRVNGLLVPPGDPGALSDALASLVADGRFAAELGRGAGRSATEFRAAAVVPRFERAYERVLEARRHDPGRRRRLSLR